MQGTVFSFEETTQEGSVVLDSGRRIDFDATAFAASGLRLLRPGQRARFDVEGDRIVALTILTLAPPSD